MNKCSPAITAAIALAGMVTLVMLSSCDSQKPATSDQPSPAVSGNSSIMTSAVFATDQITDNTGLSETNTAASDLVVRLCTAPSPATRGSLIAVSAVISNVSGLVGAGSDYTCLYLNTSSNVTGASFLGSYLIPAIGLHGSHTLSTSVTVPSNQPTGLNYFLAVCDCSNNVTEAVEWNNTNEVAITIN